MRAIGAIFSCVALVMAIAGCAQHRLPSRPADEAGQGTAVGEVAPDFALPSLDGAVHRLTGDSGKVVVLTFWATFCGPCRDELAALEAMRDRHRDAVFLSISVDDAASDDAVREAVGQLRLRIPVLRDPLAKVAFSYMKVMATPFTLVIGRDGRVVAEHAGYRPGDADRLERDVVAALGGSAPAPTGDGS